MSDRAGYSRVYWTVIDDPKFVGIYDDDHHFALWTRLLMIADQSHPASAHLPRNARKASIAALVDAGLVDPQPNDRYRIHGLDAERDRRRALATTRGGSGDRTVTGRSPDGFGVRDVRRDETSTRRDEHPARATDDDPAMTYWSLTGRFPQKSLTWIDEMASLFGSEAASRAMATAFIADPSTATLLGRTQDRLRAEARELDRKERDAEQVRLKEKRAQPKPLEPWREEYRLAIQKQYERLEEGAA